MADIPQAIKILKAGGVVVYPTDTAYGLAVDATNLAAVERLYKLKGRNFKKPTHVIFPDTKWLRKIVKLNKSALKLMNAFLPGPLTIVLPLRARGASWKKLSASSRTMGVRFPANATAQALVEALGKPITTTSANLSGMPTTYAVAEVKKQFAKSKVKPDFYLDGGRLKKVRPSTVVSIMPSPPAPLPRAGEGSSKLKNLFDVTIIREGPISEKQIKKALS